MNIKEAKQRVGVLVQTFHTEKRERINEAETRLRFIDPFFEALGWDIRNPKEVRIESTLCRSDSTRPDYRFIIDSKTKFFVEAKKPSVKLTDPAPVFQAKSYGFSSKVPLVILTDFEEFRPFRTLARPKYDKPLDCLIKEFDYTYEQYTDEFDNLYGTFSREAVASGELEKRIPAEKKEASQTVDKEFLKDLSKWQEELAKNIALRNSRLSVSEINEAVQRILDRIIFLRICEDRQIEESEILLSYSDKDDIYSKLLKEFTRLRTKYNGLIFNEHRLSEQLSIDDKLLKDIIKNLYLPRSPYRFNEIPIEILGTIYEQYLGRVITLTPSHRAKVEVKPEVRKAGGVFYTPQFIASYIVKNTIGRILTPTVSPPSEGGEIPAQVGRGGRTPEQIAKMKFADIACGSGSFLLEMFDYLIRYHIDYYSTNPDKIKTIDGVPDAFQTSDELWHLSTRKKKEILLNNIYGVDIDPQAVEVTQMSLYLKLLEGENAETFGRQLSFELKETILPNLAGNIKCGNSLVGMDIKLRLTDTSAEGFVPQAESTLFDVVKGLGNNLTLEEELRIRPFDWETAFPDIMSPSTSSGRGFDAIVGNPPYITIGGKEESFMNLSERDYLLSRYICNEYKPNLFSFFYEKGFGLLKEGGLISLIVPRTFLDNYYFSKLRLFFQKNSKIELLAKLNFEVFEDATTGGSAICVFRKSKPCGLVNLVIAESPTNLTYNSLLHCEQSTILFGENHAFVFQRPEYMALFEKVKNAGVNLETYCSVNNGVNTGNAASILLSDKRKGKTYRKILEGKDVFRYGIHWGGNWINYDRSLKRRIKLKDLDTRQSKIDFALRDARIFDQPKIIIRQTSDKLIGCLDEEKYISRHSTHCIVKERGELSLKYVFALFNSRLMNFYYQTLIPEKGKAFAEVKAIYIKQLPIRTIDFNNTEEKAKHDRMVQLVERMLDLHKKKQQAKADSEKELFEHQIKATDREIDQLVYKLYNITEEEQKIVEGTQI